MHGVGLHAARRVGGEGGQVEPVLGVDFLLCGDETGEAVVRGALYVRHGVAESCAERAGHRPSVFHDSRAAGYDETVVVGTVGKRIGRAELAAEIAGTKIVVGGPVHVTEGETHRIEVHDVLRITEDVVQTAPLRVGGALRDAAVHAEAVHADILVLVVVPTRAEIGDAERVGGVVDVHVLGGVQQTGHISAAAVLGVVILSLADSGGGVVFVLYISSARHRGVADGGFLLLVLALAGTGFLRESYATGQQNN